MPATSNDPKIPVKDYGVREVGQRFWPYIKPHRWRWILAGVLVSIVGIAIALMPLFPKFVIDRALPHHRLDWVFAAAGLFLIVMFVRMALWYFAIRQVLLVQQQVVFELRVRSFVHLQRLDQKFHGEYPTGFLYERVFGNSINVLGLFMQTVFQQLPVYISGLLFSLAFCFYLSVPLTLVIIAGAAGYVLTAQKLSRRIYSTTRSANEAGMRVVEIIMDKLRGQKTIQAFAMESYVEEEFRYKLWPTMVKWMDSVIASMTFGFVTEGLSYVVNAMVVVGGAILVLKDPMHEVGLLVAFMGYEATLITMLQTLTNLYGQMISAKSAFDQLFTILDTESTVAEKPGARMPATTDGHLEVKNVSFAYEPDRPVIENLNLTIPHGQIVALVGRSGSGKSSFTNLLIRFFDPISGSIHLDGNDIRDLPLRAYREQFSVVMQDPYLFDISIAENFRCVKPDVTEEEMISVLKQARAWSFVEKFPDRLNHRVGEAGSQLSGGQRQRLAIARCMLLPSKFVILDEATSALDVESELAVQESLESLFEGRTVFIIAHRLSTIRRATRILVMDEGKLVEDGSFEELLANDGIFSHLHSISNAAYSRPPALVNLS